MAWVFDENISPLMEIATNEDLDPLVEYIKKSTLTEQLTSSEEYKKFAPDHKKYSKIIETEISRFGGNSFLNFFRNVGPKYYVIVKDVADRLEVKYQGTPKIEDLELGIILNVLGTAWQKMEKSKKQEFIDDLGLSGSLLKSIPSSLPFATLSTVIATSGYAAYVATLTVANAISTQLIGRCLSFALNTGIARVVSAFAGPLAWFITGVWTTIDIAGPAYRVTIPCVVHISLLRQKYLMKHCKNCSAPIASSDKFCPNCGSKIED